MKKETIFRHELNESIQVDAAMNCLKNRNTRKQINEVAPAVATAGRMLLPMLRPIITKLVQKALVKIGTHARPTQVITLVMNMLAKGEFAKKMAEKCGQTWNEIPSDVKKEIQDAIIDAFKKQSPQEQEETVDYAQLADDVCASYRGSLSKLDLKNSINYIVKMVAKKIGKTVDELTPQELTAIQKAAKHSVWYVSEHEEDITPHWVGRQYNGGIDFDSDGNLHVITPDEDDDEFEWVYDAARDIINKKFAGKALVEIAPDQVKDDIRSMIMKEYKIRPKNADEHRAWVKNIELAFDYATNHHFDSQEQEELPSMERKDMILALAEYMSESWIDTGDDGDLDDIYYAIADILDKTGDYPQSTDWEDCKPWCQKHYKEVEARIY